MSFKAAVHAQCLAQVAKKIRALETQLAGLVEDAKNDSKSTAGDKHETARAMMQLEQEKLGRQLRQFEEQQALLEKTGVTAAAGKIITGSLLKTNRGWIYLLTALGELKIDDQSVFVISMQSPLGLQLAGLSEGGSVTFNGITYSVETLL